MTPAPVQPFPNAPQDQQVYSSNPVAPATSAAGVLARTPFETAPPEVQRNVIVSAQIALARRGLYHEAGQWNLWPGNGAFAASVSSTSQTSDNRST